jgi:hypothetical protein
LQHVATADPDLLSGGVSVKTPLNDETRALLRTWSADNVLMRLLRSAESFDGVDLKRLLQIAAPARPSPLPEEPKVA